jgi:hypothetical protein
MRNPLRIDGSTPKEIVITLTALPDIAWTKVRGSVTGLRYISEPVSVLLTNDRTKHELLTNPKADGTFEFPKVAPGTYSIGLAPSVAAASSKSITIDDREIPHVNLEIPARRNVVLRVVSEAGSLPTSMSLVLRLNRFEAYTLFLHVPMVLRTSNPWRCIEDVCSTSMEKTLGIPSVVSHVPADGRYVLRLPEGEYSVEVQGVTQTDIVSISHGDVDLLGAPLRVSGDETKDVVVSLRRPGQQ